MVTLYIGFQHLLDSNEERYCTNSPKLSKPPSPCHSPTMSICQRPIFQHDRTTSIWTKLAQNQRRYVSSSFRSIYIDAPSTSEWTEKHLAYLERYSPTLTTKISIKTRHGLRLRILEHHQFYQQPPPRAHQQYQNKRNIPNTQII